jgi:hypothetical protein
MAVYGYTRVTEVLKRRHHMRSVYLGKLHHALHVEDARHHNVYITHGVLRRCKLSEGRMSFGSEVQIGD